MRNFPAHKVLWEPESQIIAALILVIDLKQYYPHML